jgi:hypothetical protein
MIIPIYNNSDNSRDMALLQPHWGQRAPREAIIRSLRDSFELYLGATEYLSMAMMLFQPKTADIIQKSKSQLLWAYSAEALFDSAALLIFNLYDPGNNQFKNLTSIQKQINLLPPTSAKKSDWDLDPSVDFRDSLLRIENRRNKNISHHERAGHNPIEWGDLILALEYARKYMQRFYIDFMEVDYDIPSMKERAGELSHSVFAAIGTTDKSDQALILRQFEEFVDKSSYR